MNITATLKKTLDDLQLDQRVETFAQDLDRFSAQALETIGGYVSSREEHITGLVEKVATTLDTRTEGRFAGEIGKVAGLVQGGVTKLVEQRPTPES